jgi:hypothetical protein
MDELKLQPIDFSALSPARWRFRRGCIGVLLVLYFLYAFLTSLFMFSVDFLEDKTSTTVQSVEANPQPKDQESLPGLISREHRQQLTMLATFGFLGSLFCISRIFVLTTNRIDMPAVWYITRPFQSILMAWFFYYAFLAGQLVFYSGDPSATGGDTINIYSLAILAIVAGVFTEQAYEALRTFAFRLFKQTDKTSSAKLHSAE